MLTHNPVGFTACMGLISLSGIVVRNGIILVDHITAKRRAGLELVGAATEAGQRRLRPIFLTTMAAAVGVTPMILGGSSLWSPLASVLAFGLVLSMGLTLLVIPVLYVVVYARSGVRPAVPATPVAVSLAVLALALAPGPAAASGGSQRARWCPPDTAGEVALAKPAADTTDTANAGGASAASAPADTDAGLLTRWPPADEPSGPAALPPVTLQEARTRGLRQAHVLGVARARVAEQRALERRARARQWPQVGVDIACVGLTDDEWARMGPGQLGQVPGLGAFPPAALALRQDHFLVAAVTARQPVTQLRQIRLGLRAATASTAIARAEQERAQAEVALAITQAYCTALVAQSQEAAAQAAVVAAEAAWHDAQAATVGGLALDLALATAQANRLDRQLALATAQAAGADRRAALLDLLGLPVDAPLYLVEPPDPADGLWRDDYHAQAGQHNPEVAVARHTVARATAGLAAARDDYLPDLGGFVTHAWQEGLDAGRARYTAFGAVAQWTLWDGGERAAAVAQRQAQVQQAEAEQQRQQGRLSVDIDRAWRQLATARQVLTAKRQLLAVRRESERLAKQQHDAGTLADARWYEAQAAGAAAVAEHLQARLAVILAIAELERLAGTLR